VKQYINKVKQSNSKPEDSPLCLNLIPSYLQMVTCISLSTINTLFQLHLQNSAINIS